MTHQQPHSGAAQQAARILRSLTASGPLCFERERPGGRSPGRAADCCSSLELERRELLESIVESLSANTRLTELPFGIEQGFCAGGAQPPCQGLSGSRPPARTEAAVELLRHLAGGLAGTPSGRASRGRPTRLRKRVLPPAGPSCGPR